MNILKLTVVSLTFMSLFTGYSMADELIIPIGQQAAEKQAVERPVTGMNTSAVREKFGDPASTDTAVGTPPIIRWHYADFTVYFEGDKVIHAVLNH